MPRVERGTRLPEDWRPDLAAWQFAQDKGLDPEQVLDRFRDFWMAKSGADATKLNWPATWRNWCRSDAEKRDRFSRPKETPFDRMAAKVRQQEEISDQLFNLPLGIPQ